MRIVLPQIVSIGIYNSQTAVKNRAVTKERATGMFEIELPMEEGGASFIDGAEAPVSPMRMICAKAGQIRKTRLPFKCYYIHMILHEGYLYDALMQTPSFIEITDREKYLSLFQRLCRYYESDLEEDTVMVEGLVLELLHALYRDAVKQQRRTGEANGQAKIIDEAVRYITANPAADLSLAALARRFNLGTYYFHHCFKRYTGLTLRVFVEEQRIKRAATLLLTTGDTLTKIAADCGFSSQSYFNYAFKRKKGVTPRQFAKAIAEKYEK